MMWIGGQVKLNTSSITSHRIRSVIHLTIQSSAGHRLAGVAGGSQNQRMKSASGDQGTLFDPAPSSWPARRRRPPRQTTVAISTETIAAVIAGRVSGERAIQEAIAASRPDVRNVAIDLGTIRWTDPKTGRRVIFNTPIVVRDALLDLARGAPLHPRPRRAGNPRLTPRIVGIDEIARERRIS
jgi:hypothetical protein